MHQPLLDFLTLPTKTVVQVDYETLLQTLKAGPILLRLEDHLNIKVLYLQAQKQGFGKLSVKTVHLVQGGQSTQGYLVTLKEQS